MNKLSILLIPSICLVLGACASGPPGPTVYAGGGYGPGPNPEPGYYWNGTVYVQGDAPWHHSDQYNRNVTDVNRTTVNDRTVNNSTVNDTTVNDRTVNRTNVNQTTAATKAIHKKKAIVRATTTGNTPANPS